MARSIVQPPLTRADKSYHTDALRAERQRPEQVLDVAYETDEKQPATDEKQPATDEKQPADP